jgi:hypothetical protein
MIKSIIDERVEENMDVPDHGYNHRAIDVRMMQVMVMKVLMWRS